VYHRLWQFPTLYLIYIGFLATTVLSGVSIFLRASITFTVTKVADTNDGACDADCSLREAIVAANAAPGLDTIILPAGIYRLSRAGGLEDAAATGDLDITDPLTIIGASPDTTVIDAKALDRVIDIKSLGVTLAHVTIQQGVEQTTIPGYGGGGIRIMTGVLILQDTQVISNTASYGAGIYNEGTLVMTNSAVRANWVDFLAGRGGGIYNTGTLTITNSMLTTNIVSRFGDAGGIYNTGRGAVISSTLSSHLGAIRNDGTLLVAGSSLNGNARYAFANSGTLLVQGSTLNGNGGQLGGGSCAIENSGALTMTVSTISGNGDVGGGAVCNTGAMLFTDSTIAGNYGRSAVRNGLGDTLVLKNTIVANPLTINCEGLITSAGFNLDSGTSCGLTGPGDRSNTEALLGPLQNNGGSTLTHALRPGSPAIDASSSCEPSDQRGVRRPQGRACDIGAYEYDAALHRLFLSSIRRA
jgi:CSLREA domain-containing protein